LISIVIPTLNEEETLGEVIERCRPFGDEIMVMDGHSTDKTVDIARQKGARLEMAKKRGKGSALREAALLAKGDVLVFIDADGSHIPEDIPKLMAPINEGRADMVVASRLLGGSSELHGGFDEFLRFAGSSFITACINKRYHVRLSDSQNGFRAIRKSVFLSLGLKSHSTTIEQEMTMKALAKGCRIEDIPSHEHPRKGGVSKVHVFRLWHKYGWNLLCGLLP